MQGDDERIARLEQRVATLEQQLVSRTQPAPARPAPSAPARVAPPAPSPAAQDPYRRGQWSLDLESLLTTRTLAWVGGAVLLLGLAFFLAIAVDRGWINEPARVILGSLFSGALLGFAAALRHRYGRVEAGLIAAGAGLAGLFFSDLAAGPLYDLLPVNVTIVIALGIAAVAVLLALYWSAEPIAAVGLVGAMVAAPVILSEIRLSGLCVVAILLAATALLMIMCDWRLTMMAGIAASLPQAFYWIALHNQLHAQGLALTGTFWALTMAAMVTYELLSPEDRHQQFTVSAVLAASSFALGGLLITVNGTTFGLERDGLAVAALGLAYVGATAALWVGGRTAAHRDLRSLLGAIGLSFIALALFIVFKHHTLVISLGVQAVLLAWLGRALDEERLNFAACAYMGAALIYLVAYEAPPKLLFDSDQSPGIELIGVAAAALSAVAVSYFSSDPIRKVFAWAAGSLLVYLGSLAIIAVLASPTHVFETTNVSFQRAQTVVSIFWGAGGFLLLVVGLRRRLPALRSAGFVLLGAALAKAFLFDLSSLTAFARALSFLGLGTLLLVAAVVHQQLSRPPEDAVR
jgi:uncharacterized membrane protein